MTTTLIKLAAGLSLLGLALLVSGIAGVTGPTAPVDTPSPYRSATPAERADHAIDAAIERDTVAQGRRGR
jgi:hypothetical protein